MTARPTTDQTPQARRHWSLILPHAPLPEALAICLDMVGSGRYERAAISWHTRFCAYAPGLTFATRRPRWRRLPPSLIPDVSPLRHSWPS